MSRVQSLNVMKGDGAFSEEDKSNIIYEAMMNDDHT